MICKEFELESDYFYEYTQYKYRCRTYRRGFDLRLHEVVFDVILIPQNIIQYYVQI